jgi:exodeoxyribonuclease VII small subunit
MSPAKPKESFEELYSQLETKIAVLEQGGLSLDDSISAYEEAVALANRCQTLLETAELRITRLKQSFAGDAAIAAAQFDDTDEELF